MARLGKQRWNVDGSPIRNSIGENNLLAADTTIRAWEEQLTEMAVASPGTREAICSMLFSDATVAKLTAVRGLVETSSFVGHYPLPDFPNVLPTTVQLNFMGAKMVTPATEAICYQHERADKLFNTVVELTILRMKMARVQHVLRWLNSSATAGAVRYLFPQVLALCPNAPIPAELPKRYDAPADAGELMPVVRAAAQTVAQCLMLPKAEPTVKTSNVTLIVKSTAFLYEGCQVKSDQRNVKF